MCLPIPPPSRDSIPPKYPQFLLTFVLSWRIQYFQGGALFPKLLLIPLVRRALGHICFQVQADIIGLDPPTFHTRHSTYLGWKTRGLLREYDSGLGNHSKKYINITPHYEGLHKYMGELCATCNLISGCGL